MAIFLPSRRSAAFGFCTPQALWMCRRMDSGGKSMHERRSAPLNCVASSSWMREDAARAAVINHVGHQPSRFTANVAGRSEEIVELAAAEMSWSWSAPLASGRLLTVAFTTPRFFHRLEGSLEERYRHLLLEAGVLDTHSSLHSPPRVCDATPYLRDKATNALLRVGDADVALDPLSSSGIQAAVQSALCAAPVVNTLLSPGADTEAALEYWDRRRTERARSHERWSAQRYREAFALRRTEFWRTRAMHYVEDAPSHGEMPPLPRPEQAIALSSSATLIEAACLQGKFVVRKQCLTHPHLREPIAYVDGLFLAPMLRILAEAKPAAHVIAAWSSLCSPGKGLALLGWLWQRQIAVAA
jgi:hypothetical protein